MFNWLFVYGALYFIHYVLEITIRETEKDDAKGMFNGLSKFLKLIRNRNSVDEEENITKNESRVNLNSNMDLRNPKGKLH